MTRSSLTAWAVLCALAFTTNVANAQGALLDLPAVSPSKGVIYRLGSDANHTEGCIPPCLCPVVLYPDMTGTYTLRLTSIGQFSRTYAVEQVNWTVDIAGTPTKVKGSGTYTRTASPLGLLHQMELELSVGSAPPAKFDSGAQPDPNTFPSIDIGVADNDFCFARGFYIDSDPAPKKFITRYALTGTTYQEGCYPPCKCPISIPVNVRGTFDLVLLEDLGTIETFSITNVDWTLVSLTTSRAAVLDRFTGTGDYVLIQGFAGPIHKMDLCLDRNGVALAPFSSGSLMNTAPGPEIDIVVSQNGMVCFDRVFDILAKPDGLTTSTKQVLATSGGR